MSPTPQPSSHASPKGPTATVDPSEKETAKPNVKDRVPRRARRRKPRLDNDETGGTLPSSPSKPSRKEGVGRNKPNANGEHPVEALPTPNQHEPGRVNPKSFKERMDKFSLANKPIELPTTPLGSEKELPPKPSRPRTRRRGGRSNPSAPAADHSATDLRTKLISSLSDATYECMVCWEPVAPRNPTWSCKLCWAVFHLNCIKKWSRASNQRPEDGRLTVDRSDWRCPGCQLVQVDLPSKYLCFCGKVTFPEFTRFATPHSCAQPCQKSRGEACPHPCPELCHPGPCPPCTAMSPPIACYCGRTVIQARCGELPGGGVSCFNSCGELLGCGKHHCAEPCHDGTCPPCKEQVAQTCYCGGHTRVAPCSSGVAEPTWILDFDLGQKVKTVGYFSCGQPCQQPLDCHVHRCSQVCHPLEEEISRCPRSPAVLSTCPCGKALLSDLCPEPRKTCEDEVPFCSKPCLKPLPCVHPCQSPCHGGECPPCGQLCRRSCRCGSTSTLVRCSDPDRAVACDKVCQQKKLCSRHRCFEVCCPASNKRPGADPGLHICLEPCHRKLSCGRHLCQQLCHRGGCRPCLEASFEDLPCSCGRTVLRAPIPCGAGPPECRFPCQKPRPCGHSTKLTHPCHPDSIGCPPCPALTTKLCRCGKRDVKNVPCFRLAPSCGTTCGKLLPCGAHTCKEICHGGPCLGPSQSCTAVCQKPLSGCGHPCPMSCHAPALCPTDVVCRASVQVPCECGRRKVTETCDGQPPSSRPPVACDDQCRVEIRNKKLAEALGISSTAPAIDSTSQYDWYIFDFTPAQLKWVKEIEQRIHSFVDSSKVVLHFNPMRKAQRKFLHCIAPNYLIKSLSLDDPPNKSVQYTKTPQTRIPSVLPSEAYKFPDKYMAEPEVKPVRQAANLILLRNLELTPSITPILQKALSACGTQADIFPHGSNIIIKPHGTVDPAQDEGSIRILSSHIRSALSSAHFSVKPLLGRANSALEVVWPKLSAVPASTSDGAPAANKFAYFQPSLFPSTLQGEPSKGVSGPKSPPTPPSPKPEVVEDWVELI
ncbi:FKBP12-associated protein [Massospora cicadina]|nr:FKBP12-associated protein [Massospora cicadina]